MKLIPLPIKILFMAFLLVTAAGWGYMRGSSHAEVELANFQAKSARQIAALEVENAKNSNKISIQYVDRVNTIHEKEVVYKNSIAQLPPQFDLSKGWVEIHDAAVKSVNPDTTLASDKTPSGVMDTSALSVVTSNYATCNQNKEQLLALQEWIRTTKASIEAANAKKGK